MKILMYFITENKIVFSAEERKFYIKILRSFLKF